MNGTAQDQLTAELARAVAARAAPQQAPHVAAASRAYSTNPTASLGKRSPTRCWASVPTP